LFQGGNPTRYPRGYPPERMREVLDRVHPKTYDARSSSPETRAILDTVARSTVPGHQMQNVEFVPAETKVSRGAYAGLQVGGSYQTVTTRQQMPDGGLEFPKHGRVTVARGQEGTTTPIHELGHHVSQITGRPSSQYNTVSRKGADEGFAETFAETHSRDARGRPPADFSTNPLKWSNNMSNASRAQFAKHFDKERVGAPSVVAQAEEAKRGARRGEQLSLELGGPIYAKADKVAPWRTRSAG
jgi:hypothetical protein